VVLAPTGPNEEPLVLNRILVQSGSIRGAAVQHRSAEVAGKGVGVAMSG